MAICIPTTTNWGGKVWAGATAAELVQKLLAEKFAWTAMQLLSGNRLSLCAITVRPTRQGCFDRSYYLAPGSGGSFLPYIGANGLWYNHVGDCSCDSDHVEEIALAGPVGRIVSVEIDNQPISPLAYRVDNFTTLVRQDGGKWPVIQNMNLPLGAVGTFGVTYFRGNAPDELDDYAAGVLAQEFLKAVSGDKKCRLPSNVTAVTRQGVSYEIATSMFEDGLSGITEVDIVIARHNPYKLKSASRIMSVDSIRQAQRHATGSAFAPTVGDPTGSGLLVPDPNNPGYYIILAV